MTVIYQRTLAFRRQLLEIANEQARSWLQAPEEVAAVEEGIREFIWHRDRFDGTYRKVLRQARKWSKQDLSEVAREALRVCRSGIVLHDTLRDLVEKLTKQGRAVRGAKGLERAAADFDRWLEDLPDEMMLHYHPATAALEKVALESLRNPPTASDWQSLCDELPSSHA